mmetsp:Transcript_30355/g.36854  ORF Transcript_30355/g.36854 Transcript_30355/m.36854 type:complete len:224 (+) Transcript_30355:288-959(+)
MSGYGTSGGTGYSSGGYSMPPVQDNGTDTKPGDWNCVSCGNKNFAFRDKCNRCKEDKPAGAPAAISTGSNIGGYASGGFSSMGGGMTGMTQSPLFGMGGFTGGLGGGSGFHSGGHVGGGGRDDTRPGDWFCPDCNNKNFAFRDKCHRCGIDKPADAVDASVSHKRGPEDFPSQEFGHQPKMRKAGDWTCTKCQNYNYAFRTECKQCQAPKESATDPAPAAEEQ